MTRSFVYALITVAGFLAVTPIEAKADYWDRRGRQSSRYWQRQGNQAHRYWNNRWDGRGNWHRGYRSRGYYPYRYGYGRPYRGGVFFGPFGVRW